MQMLRKKVLLIEPTIHRLGIELLQTKVDIVMAPDGKEDTLIRYLQDEGIEALIARVELITKRVIDSAAGLRVIGQHGAGLDNIDVKAAQVRGIRVVNAPGVNAISVAEHVIMLMLGVSKRIVSSDTAVRSGDWSFRNRMVPIEMNGKTLLLLGLGAIGRNVAQKARTAFNMKIYAYDPLISELEMRALGVEKVNNISKALPIADYVSIHVPLMESTKGMIGEKELRSMKESAYIINTSRGPLINEKALIDVLKENRIAGAGLDVFEQEPPSTSNGLFCLPNVIVTPHFAGDTEESKQRTTMTIVKAVLNALA
ncbi:hypothetical protein EH55_01540 [Synergistes jonesii]|uniref:3-phosphoglycerate dehydrogenase n=2 Tax=Synergistes jonesii TaxID=2754 RepID=A0A073IVA1_9BACT|nr:hypothetical protein EH55_01540 [Synergistes jonesii]